MRCPSCESEEMFRIGRVGFLQMRIFPLLSYYPWKSRRCAAFRMKRVRGERKKTVRKAEPR
jgi:hypothetical protein